MIPNIFISSTITDLSHLRDSIRNIVQDIGYNPIMSEHAEIGYLPNKSAEDSCYYALKDCQLAIFIIGKRYGSLSDNGFSITQNEYLTAREIKTPIIFLVDHNVMQFKQVFEANPDNKEVKYPGMDDPIKTFAFIADFSNSDVNNGLIEYSDVHSAQANLKKQLALIVGYLLTKYHDDPIKGEIKDILTEITNLKHHRIKKDQDIAHKFSVAFRFLLERENVYIKEVSEFVAGTLEDAVPILVESESMLDFLRKSEVEVEILTLEEADQKLDLHSFDAAQNLGISKSYFGRIPYMTIEDRATLGAKPRYPITPTEGDERIIFAVGPKKYIGNKNSIELLEAMFSKLLELVS